MFLKIEEHLEKTEKTANAGKQYMQTLKEGFTYVKNKKIVMNFCIMAFVINATLVPLNALQAPLVTDVLGQGSELLSVMGIAMVAGMGVASVIFPYIVKKFQLRTFLAGNGIGLAICFSAVTWGSYLSGNTAGIYAITAAAFFGLGVFCDLMNCAVSVQMMKCVDEDYLARVSALMGAGATAATPVMSFLISGLVKYISVKKIMNACSIACAIIFVMAIILKVKLEEEEKDETEGNIEQAC